MCKIHNIVQGSNYGKWRSVNISHFWWWNHINSPPCVCLQMLSGGVEEWRSGGVHSKNQQIISNNLIILFWEVQLDWAKPAARRHPFWTLFSHIIINDTKLNISRNRNILYTKCRKSFILNLYNFRSIKLSETFASILQK